MRHNRILKAMFSVSYLLNNVNKLRNLNRCVKMPTKGPHMMQMPLALINQQIWLSAEPAGRLPSSSPVLNVP